METIKSAVGGAARGIRIDWHFLQDLAGVAAICLIPMVVALVAEAVVLAMR